MAALYRYVYRPALGGMNGVHDQIVALRWVKEHIGEFGGDHERVTLFGSEAGGQSICSLLISPWARDLFSRAIIESGPCIGAGAPTPIAAAQGMFDEINAKLSCNHSEQVINCYRKKKKQDLAKGLARLPAGLFPGCSADMWIQPVDDAATLFQGGDQGLTYDACLHSCCLFCCCCCCKRD